MPLYMAKPGTMGNIPGMTKTVTGALTALAASSLSKATAKAAAKLA